MVGDILKIKTNIPPLGTNILTRFSIKERLEEDLTVAEGFTRQLTLFSAPAGFGKTTLARKWLVGREDQTAWYSLDDGDNEPERFWIYLISALQTLKSGIGNGPLEMLRSSGLFLESSSGSESLLTPLLNDLFALEAPLFLVLDDYHLINNPQIHEAMIFFIENLPPALHLVVTTRSDPPWPLSRWRGRGKMTEIRLDDLKFSEEETGHLFANIKGIQLNESQLNTLYNKTEGWITGLQLAAFSLSTSRDADEFIENFAGSHRHVLHFLSEEVYNRQPEPVQEFLLQTSILNRFCAPLCNVVTGRNDSADVMASLERDNLFLIPLDEQGNWYRYHPLFSDLLLYHLKRSFPEKLNELNERAGRWFLEAGEHGKAIRHALTSKNLNKVAQILHEHYGEILQTDGPRQLNQCLESFPQELLKRYPRLAVHKALFYLTYKGREEAKVYLDLAEELGYENKKEQDEFKGLLAAVTSYYNICTHNFSQALKNAEKALKLLPSKNFFWRMSVAIYSGDARLFSGNPKGAYPFYLEAHRNNQKVNNHFLSLTSGFKVATALYYLGRLRESEEFTQEMLRSSRDEGISRVPRAGLLWVLLGELLREKGNLEEAERCVERGLLLSKPEKPSLGWNYLYKVALCFSQNDYHKALQNIKRIETINNEVRLPLFITSIATIWEAHLFLKLGNISKARTLLSKAGISENTDVQGGQERGYLVLARILLTEKEGNPIRIRKIIDRIEELALLGEHKRLLLETLMVKATLEEKTGASQAAELCLFSAMQKGKESGYFQLFLDEGKELASVFLRIVKGINTDSSTYANGGMLEYVMKICQEISPDKKSAQERQETRRKVKKTEGGPYQGLIEELSRRELEILELISRGLSNQDISQKLFLSLGTVKWHTSNIYGKLGVTSRTQAAAQARKLNLFS